MKAIPAIDVLNEKVVRLVKGRYDDPVIYADKLDELMERLVSAGFDQVHLVDLEGARSGESTLVSGIRQWTGVIGIQIGGGIRTEEDVVTLLEAGVSRIVLGSIAARDPELVVRWGEKYGFERFVLAADSLKGKVAVAGWIDTTVWTTAAFIQVYLEKGFRNFLCTDISRDGTLEGPSLEWYRSLRTSYPGAWLIASGGVSDVSDLTQLEGIGMDAAVVGKAWLEGRITLQELLNHHRSC